MLPLIEEISQLLHAIAQAEAATILPVSDPALQRFTNKTGLIPPTSVVDWLKMCNGLQTRRGRLLGVEPLRRELDIELFYNANPEWRDLLWMPVAADGFGNFYVTPIQTTGIVSHPVMFLEMCSSAMAPAYVAASDIWHFVRGFLRRVYSGDRGWPFDRDLVSSFDPDMLTLKDLPMPWE